MTHASHTDGLNSNHIGGEAKVANTDRAASKGAGVGRAQASLSDSNRKLSHQKIDRTAGAVGSSALSSSSKPGMATHKTRTKAAALAQSLQEFQPQR